MSSWHIVGGADKAYCGSHGSRPISWALSCDAWLVGEEIVDGECRTTRYEAKLKKGKGIAEDILEV
jgi:hypothetical protein